MLGFIKTNFLIRTSLLIVFFFSVNHCQSKVIQIGVSESTPVEIIAEWPVGPGTQVGEHFSARIVSDVISSSGEIFIPRNSRVIGTIINKQDSRHFHKDGKVDIQFEKIVFPDNISTLVIAADGQLLKHNKKLEVAGGALRETLQGAITGAMTGFRFGGIIGTSSSEASNIAIGAATGAGISLISFIAQKGKDVEIYPGLPMVLNIAEMQKSKYTAQQIKIPQNTQKISAKIKNFSQYKVRVSITNQSDKSIPISNLKIVDGLGYTIKPNIAFKYHDKKNIPAKSEIEYEFRFSPTSKTGRYWLVLTDSFHKQEYFREELLN